MLKNIYGRVLGKGPEVNISFKAQVKNNGLGNEDLRKYSGIGKGETNKIVRLTMPGSWARALARVLGKGPGDLYTRKPPSCANMHTSINVQLRPLSRTSSSTQQR